MIQGPPSLPSLDGLPRVIQDYLSSVNDWLFSAYNKLKFIDLGNVKFTSSELVPSGGQDGDTHWRVAGASTAIYLNKNGVWVAYNNP